MARKVGNPIDVVVGQNLARIRKAKGLSQSAIADALGISFQQVQKYEKGTNRISASVLFELAQALSVSMDDFFKGAEAVNAKLESTKSPLPTGDLTRVASPAVRKALLSLIRSVSVEAEEAEPSQENLAD